MCCALPHWVCDHMQNVAERREYLPLFPPLTQLQGASTAGRHLILTEPSGQNWTFLFTAMMLNSNSTWCVRKAMFLLKQNIHHVGSSVFGKSKCVYLTQKMQLYDTHEWAINQPQVLAPERMHRESWNTDQTFGRETGQISVELLPPSLGLFLSGRCFYFRKMFQKGLNKCWSSWLW